METNPDKQHVVQLLHPFRVSPVAKASFFCSDNEHTAVFGESDVRQWEQVKNQNNLKQLNFTWRINTNRQPRFLLYNCETREPNKSPPYGCSVVKNKPSKHLTCQRGFGRETQDVFISAMC